MEEIIQDFERVCKHCGKDISEKQKKQVFCSKQCANEYNVKSPNHAANNRKNIWTCKRCGKEFHAPKDRSTYCSRECAFAYCKENGVGFRGKRSQQQCKIFFNTCSICGMLFTTRNPKQYLCSKLCRREYARRHTRAENIKRQSYARRCGICGASFIPEYGQSGPRLFCSDSCQLKAKTAHKKNAKHKRRLRKQEAYIENVNFFKVYSRDSGRCRICGKKLKMTNKVPHPNAPTIDHIIPIANGGLHEYKNVQLACFMCNATKGSKQSTGGDQLLLFGL